MKKILIFSMTPLFPSYAMGGSQKILQDIAEYLGKLNNEVTILCTSRSDSPKTFQWNNNVNIIPIFRFKQPYPNPYATAPYNISYSIAEVSKYLDHSDRFYIHDGAFIFPYVYSTLPTIVSLRDVVYSETLQGAFLFQGDKLILPSKYCRDVYLNTVGIFFPELKKRTVIIHNGFDHNIFKKTRPRKIQNIIKSVDLFKHKIILHPHRPDPNKGIDQTIDLVNQLVNKYRMKNIRVLVPKWLDVGISKELRDYYKRLENYIASLGMENNFVFHDWVPLELMPEYYSIGSLTLCLGSYVETFGNVVFESLSCGTPVIMSKVGPYRSLLPENMVHKVDFGDLDASVQKSLQIICGSQTVNNKVIRYIKRHFSKESMLESFADAILTTKKKKPLIYKKISWEKSGMKFSLAPWCYIARDKVYNDFSGKYVTSSNLKTIIKFFRNSKFSLNYAQKCGISKRALLNEIYRGNLIIKTN